jgi:3-dehydroquinate synthase
MIEAFMDTLKINSKIKPFTVYFVEDFSFIETLTKLENSMVIVGSIVYKHYQKKIFDQFPADKLIVLELDEKRKTLESVTKIYDKLLGLSAKKNLNLISFGGGINQDVVGFAASTLYRGVNWIFVPTTLLAMADSAIGLKTSLNYQSYKNVIGTFYPPSQIYLNVTFVDTLETKDYYSGVGEIVKFLLMEDDAFNNLDKITSTIDTLTHSPDKSFLTNIVKKSIQIKLSYMDGDEFDTGRRNLLNYGHELGHALESASNFAIPHGIAVMIGMLFANQVSNKRKWLTSKTYEYINTHILLNNLQSNVIKLKKEYFNENVILENMKRDKKRLSDSLPLVLPDKNNSLIKITDFSFSECLASICELKKMLRLN